MSTENCSGNEPKLKVSGLGWMFDGEILALEQARFFPYGGGALIVVEGNLVGSYEDICKIAQEVPYKYKDYLDVMFLPIIVGG